MVKGGVEVSMTVNDAELKSLMGKLLPKTLVGEPFRKVMRKALLVFQKTVAESTPVQTGRLRGSIADASKSVQIDSRAVPKWGQVASNVQYAPSVEYGGLYKGKYIPPRYVVESTPLAGYASGQVGAGKATRHKRIFEGIGPFQYSYRERKEKALKEFNQFGSMVDKIWRK